MTRLLLAIGIGAAFVWSCGDPLHNARVEALGSEQSGVSPGPTHRPGQPCLTCHGGMGPADVEFGVAGTIFQNSNSGSPGLAGATVTIYDATEALDGGTPHTATTNSAGNFYIQSDAWSPTYALHDISVGFAGLDSPTQMHGNVGRDGSCATCHFDPAGTGSHGHIYLVVDPADFPGAGP
jgi:hypothetical protein